MKIRVMSDLHLEFGTFTIPKLDGDKETVLVLAGDITVASSRNATRDFLKHMAVWSEQFKAIIMIAGNHEHYNGEFSTTTETLQKQLAIFDNVYFLEKETKVIDNVAFIGATAWTDCGKDDPRSTYLWHGMSDFTSIKAFGKPFIHTLSIQDNKSALEYFQIAAKTARDNGNKVVLIMHHAPSYLSVQDKYKTASYAAMNMFFASALDDEIEAMEADYLIHGHMHDAVQYYIGKTFVVCNPRGYHGYECKPELRGFDSELTLKV